MGLETAIIGSVLGGAASARASKKAASAQKEAAYEANQTARDLSAEQIDLYKQIWEKQQADYKPYLEQGTWSINSLGDLMKKGSGQLNNPFDTYLASKGVSNKFDSSNTRLDSLMKTGSGQLNNPFDTYLASKGLAGGQFNQNNPQYQFLLKQGQQALDRSAAARGMGYSGAQMKAAQQYGQGLASQEYDKQYNRALSEFGDYYRMAGNEYDRANQQYTNEYNRASGEFGDYFNRLAGLSQGGQQAATTTSQLGGQYGQNVGGTLSTLSGQLQNNIGQLGNARASGYIGQANAITGGLQGITDNLFRAASLFGGGR